MKPAIFSLDIQCTVAYYATLSFLAPWCFPYIKGELKGGRLNGDLVFGTVIFTMAQHCPLRSQHTRAVVRFSLIVYTVAYYATLSFLAPWCFPYIKGELKGGRLHGDLVFGTVIFTMAQHCPLRSQHTSETFNSLTPRRCVCALKLVILKLLSNVDVFSIPCEFDLR